MTTQKDFQAYEVTGTDREGKRFKFRYQNRIQAENINLWRGTVWGITGDGKRRLLRKVEN